MSIFNKTDYKKPSKPLVINEQTELSLRMNNTLASFVQEKKIKIGGKWEIYNIDKNGNSSGSALWFIWKGSVIGKNILEKVTTNGIYILNTSLQNIETGEILETKNGKMMRDYIYIEIKPKEDVKEKPVEEPKKPEMKPQDTEPKPNPNYYINLINEKGDSPKEYTDASEWKKESRIITVLSEKLKNDYASNKYKLLWFANPLDKKNDEGEQINLGYQEKIELSYIDIKDKLKAGLTYRIYCIVCNKEDGWLRITNKDYVFDRITIKIPEEKEEKPFIELYETPSNKKGKDFDNKIELQENSEIIAKLNEAGFKKASAYLWYTAKIDKKNSAVLKKMLTTTSEPKIEMINLAKLREDKPLPLNIYCEVIGKDGKVVKISDKEDLADWISVELPAKAEEKPKSEEIPKTEKAIMMLYETPSNNYGKGFKDRVKTNESSIIKAELNKTALEKTTTYLWSYDEINEEGKIISAKEILKVTAKPELKITELDKLKSEKSRYLNIYCELFNKKEPIVNEGERKPVSDWITIELPGKPITLKPEIVLVESTTGKNAQGYKNAIELKENSRIIAYPNLTVQKIGINELIWTMEEVDNNNQVIKNYIFPKKENKSWWRNNKNLEISSIEIIKEAMNLNKEGGRFNISCVVKDNNGNEISQYVKYITIIIPKIKEEEKTDLGITLLELKNKKAAKIYTEAIELENNDSIIASLNESLQQKAKKSGLKLNWYATEINSIDREIGKPIPISITDSLELPAQEIKKQVTEKGIYRIYCFAANKDNNWFVNSKKQYIFDFITIQIKEEEKIENENLGLTLVSGSGKSGVGYKNRVKLRRTPRIFAKINGEIPTTSKIKFEWYYQKINEENKPTSQTTMLTITENPQLEPNILATLRKENESYYNIYCILLGEDNQPKLNPNEKEIYGVITVEMVPTSKILANSEEDELEEPEKQVNPKELGEFNNLKELIEYLMPFYIEWAKSQGIKHDKREKYANFRDFLTYLNKDFENSVAYAFKKLGVETTSKEVKEIFQKLLSKYNK